ncbi:MULTISPECIES: FecR domain-containing protein [Novosphingobium]|uniref:DUF4974 domain-containing protein n=1 Tax=Novosphingobium pentaromativorans TaxID=205844 RepID=A0A2W5NVP1_9SPHN|nr:MULTISPECIES: FecR domain-containing protein [Novosphingobium]PZQ57536.1 MAG: DUF4974 domain-containing protein [Novosphingobium pentaromativorans]GFE73749.1 iron dicitrate transporter FecR [Novosphingobium sp. TCA1]
MNRSIEPRSIEPRPFDARALEQIDSPEATAAAYFSLFRSPRATAQDYDDFERWHARDEANRLAWARVEHEWQAAGAMRTDARILAIRERALANRRPQGRWKRPLAAAIAAVAVLSAAVVYQRHESGPEGRGEGGPSLAAVQGRVISTGIGQQVTFRMTDGSTVTANTASTLAVDETGSLRRTAIRSGEAFFEVAKNPRKPFVVEAGGVRVTALGTAFAVRDTDDSVSVVLAHGQVRVDMPAAGGNPARSTVLEPGQQLVWKAGAYRTGKVDVDRRLAWRDGVISFDRVPLEDAVAEINRYSQQEIVIASPSLARHPISGTFRIGVTRGFLQSLELAGIARIENESATRAELVAP